jgi:hypothetical protein
MSLSNGSFTSTQGVSSVSPVGASTSGGGLLPFSTGTTAAGGYIAQGAGAPGAPGGSLVKKMLAGAVVGAGVGFAASFINPVVSLVTGFGPTGWAAKGIIIAAGAAIGAIGGAVTHFISKRKQNLAMQAQAQAAGQQAMQPTNVSPNGVTLRSGARGPAAKKLQADLHTLGMYTGKLTGAFDAATQAAVRKYEVMKGVQPTGQGSPDVRAAVSQDVALMRQYA